MRRGLIIIGMVLILPVAYALTAIAQDEDEFGISRFTLSGGGGSSIGGEFSLTGAAGQHDAGGQLSGGNFTLVGGFQTGSVAVPALRAVSSFGPHQHTDGASGFKADVSRAINGNTGGTVNAPLESFQARITYPEISANPSFPAGTLCVNILGFREMDIPITSRIFDNTSGISTFDGFDAGGVPWPANLGHVLIRLTGSADRACPVDLELASLGDGDGNPIALPPVLTRLVQRGDASADGVTDIADALFIAEYLAGSLPACTSIEDTACLHSVNAASVRQDGAFDQKTIADALFIAQHRAGLRDEFYRLGP